MDTTHQNEYTQHDVNQPVAQPDPNNQSSMGPDPTMQLVAHLLQAQKGGRWLMSLTSCMGHKPNS